VTPAAGYQSGSVFSKTAIALDNLKDFSTRFQFQITQSGGINDNDGVGADGLTFTVQTVANTAGGNGGGIGYSGLPNSLGVEVDTYNNGPSWSYSDNDIDGNHTAIDLGGDINSVAQAPVSDRFNNDAVWTAWVDYNGVALEVRLSEDGNRPVSPTLAYNVDLASVLGTQDAYVGFTSGTGGAWGNHDILNWTFTSEYKPIGSVPEVGSSLVLLGLSVLGLRAFSRFGKALK